MNNWEYRSQVHAVHAAWFSQTRPATPPARLLLVTPHELEAMRSDLDRGELPPDFEAKLLRLAAGDLSHQYVAQNCRTFVALLRAVREGTFQSMGTADQERLLRILAYVRKDDDAIPDYRPNGYLDDQQEVRAAVIELGPLLQAFKAWRLRHQVPGMWWN